MRLAASLVTLTTVACGSADSTDPAPSARVGTLRSQIATSNGTELNGTELNGTELNGTELNGTELNGSSLATTLVAVHLAGAARDSHPLTSVWIEEGELRAIDGFGRTLGGTDLVGSVLNGERGDGSRLKVRIQGAGVGSDGVWRYDFLYKPGVENIWEVLCPQGPGVVVSGRWNYAEGVAGGGAFTRDSSVFTVGCANSAVQKCVGLGYRPWELFGTFGTISGVELHTSCVRAIRGDFCGDGRSHTTNGRLINIYDGVGVQGDTETWPLEAEWTPNGARCISAAARDALVALGVTCGSVLDALTCGDRSHFASGSRQMTETLDLGLGL
jgi:hypothetical protein